MTTSRGPKHGIRVKAGQAHAKAAGQHIGRPFLDAKLKREIKAALAKPGRPGIRVIAKQFGVSPMTVQRISKS